MLQTLLVNLKLHFREKAQLFWLFAFPIILATMFNGMFGNIAESYALHTVDVVVVNNDDWRASPGAQMLVDGISSDTGATGADGDHAKVDDDGDTMPKLITVTEAASMEAADRALLDAKAQGRLSVDGSGKLQLAISQATQTSATDVMASSSGLDISLTVLGNIVDLYNRNTAVVVNAAQHNPSALLDDAFTGSIGSSSGFTKEVQLTNFKPSGTARYYYALLGMAAMMAMSFAVNAVSLAQANLSALGIRRSVAPLPKLQQLTVAMLYIRFGCQISLGGREWAGLGACLMASFATSAFGTLIGAIQGVSTSAKQGLCTALACTLSLFSGLYGSFAMDLSDQIAQHASLLSMLNPAQQITNLFYDILYYDSFRPLFATVGVLAAMSLVCLGMATVLLRRQRYEHL